MKRPKNQKHVYKVLTYHHPALLLQNVDHLGKEHGSGQDPVDVLCYPNDELGLFINVIGKRKSNNGNHEYDNPMNTNIENMVRLVRTRARQKKLLKTTKA
jgi:hypothetical protein